MRTSFASQLEFLLSYFTPFFPLIPAFEGLSRNHIPDCFWGFGFGRGTYDDKLLGRILQSLGARKLQDIEVFKRLYDDGCEPGGTNHQIALELCGSLQLHRKQHLPILAQWEIPYALWRISPSLYEANADKIYPVWAPADKDYWPTWDVAQDLGTMSKCLGLHSPIILAHDMLIARVLAVCWKQGWDAAPDRHAINVWDEFSIQPATRKFFSLNPGNCWIFRETIARYLHHPYHRYVSLSPPR